MDYNISGVHLARINFLQGIEMDLDANLHVYVEENQRHFTIYNDDSDDYYNAFDLCHDELSKVMYSVGDETFYTRCNVFSYSNEEIVLIQKGMIVNI